MRGIDVLARGGVLILVNEKVPSDQNRTKELFLSDNIFQIGGNFASVNNLKM